MRTHEDVDLAVQRAHSAFTIARNFPPAHRADWLRAIATGFESNSDELIDVGQRETRLAEPRMRGELVRTAFQLRLLADELTSGEILDATIDHADDAWGMGPRPDLRRVNVPIGVVGVFGASNFPFAFSVMGGDSASALAAGCAVVHKIHEAHRELGLLTAEIVVEALQTAGAPEGLFEVVTTREAGEALVDHPTVRAIGFTGSVRVGRILMERANSRPEPIPFFGELGSINPVVVTQAAWQTRSAQILAEYVGSFTLGMGQFCTKPGLLFTPTLNADDAALLVEAVTESVPAPMLTAGLAAGFLDTRNEMVSRGVSVLVEGGTGESPAPSLFTTTVEHVLQNPNILTEEMFGPASIIVQYDSDAQLEQVAALLEGQLTTTIHGETGDDVAALIEILESRSGRVLWNSWPTGVSVTYAQHHGGPYPATTAPHSTSVGTAAIRRFLRPVSYQGFPEELLPPPLQTANPWQIPRRVDGQWQRAGGDSL